MLGHTVWAQDPSSPGSFASLGPDMRAGKAPSCPGHRASTPTGSGPQTQLFQLRSVLPAAWRGDCGERPPPSTGLPTPPGGRKGPVARGVASVPGAPDRQRPSMQRDSEPNTPKGASFPTETLANSPRVASNPGSAVKTSRAGKSKTSCLNWSWQLMRDSGCRVSMISLWAGEHSPGDGKGVRRTWARPTWASVPARGAPK